jgi:glycosyltransferase 2 family protein
VNESQATEPVQTAPAEAPARRAHPYLGFALRAGLGAAVIGFLLWHYDARPVLKTFARERVVYFAATIAIYVASQVMSAYRWQLLAALLHVRGRFTEFLAYYFVGMFTNLFVPGLVGGDAARAIYLGRRHHRMGEAVASVIADRGIGLVALFWLAAAMVLAMHSTLTPPVNNTALAVGALALLGFLAAPLLARVVHLLPRRLRRAGGIVLPYLHRPASLIPAIVLSLILQISLALCQWLLALGLGLSAPLALFLLVVPIANVFASLPVTLNGLGVRETAYLVLFGMAGIGHNDAIALGLLWFAATMLGGLVGAIAFFATPLPAPPAPAAERAYAT